MPRQPDARVRHSWRPRVWQPWPLLAVFWLAALEPAAACGQTWMLATQQDVQTLAAKNCTELPADLIVTQDVEDLRPLRNITRIRGALQVAQTTVLKSLSGLEGLRTIGVNRTLGFSLYVSENSVLSSIAELSGVQGALAGGMAIRYTPGLRTLDGLQNISSVGKDYFFQQSIVIQSLLSLESLEGLSGLRRGLPGSLQVANCASLRSLKGLEGVTSVGRDTLGNSIVLAQNSALEYISHLSGLRGLLPGTLLVRRNPSLQSLRGLEGLTSVGVPGKKYYSIQLQENDVLESLLGLSGLRGPLGGGLMITSNHLLVNLQGLDGITGVGQSSEGQSLYITDNKALRSLAALGSLCDPLPGALVVEGNSALESLTGLECIRSIVGVNTDFESIRIASNPALRSMDGIGNLGGSFSGNILVLGNEAVESFPDFRKITYVFAGIKMDAGPHICLPQEQYQQISQITYPAIVAPAAWNSTRCRGCPSDCGNSADGRSIACHYGTGRCLCSLGAAGRNCASRSPVVKVVPDQILRCDRSADWMACELRVRLQRDYDAGQEAPALSLALYDTCKGESVSTSCPDAGDATTFFFHGDSKVQWLTETEGVLVASIVAPWDVTFRPTSAALLQVGYFGRGPQDALLEGTLLEVATNASTPSYPWCLDSGHCKSASSTLVTLEVLGKQRVCPAGFYALMDDNVCVQCPAGHVASPGTVFDPRNMEKPCDYCRLIFEAGSLGDTCVYTVDGMITALAGSVFLCAGILCLLFELSLLKTRRWFWRLVGRPLIIADVSMEKGRVVLTTWGPHGLYMRGRRSLHLTFWNTGHCQLEASRQGGSHRINAVIIGAKQLELLDAEHRPLQERRDTSMGTARLSLTATFWHTGFYVPRAVLVPGLVIAAILALRLGDSNADLKWIALISATVVAFVARAALTRIACRVRTPLQERLAQYSKKLSHENPHPRACERGPGRAICAGKIEDLHGFFQAFIQDRSMYYLDTNIIRPLTAHSKLSYAELVGPSQVQWFVSHYWGHPFAQTVASITRHAIIARGVDDWQSEAYWICTLSNNQYSIGEELGDNDILQSSFFKALHSPSCRGTCMILDERALPLGRSWCLFELLQTMKLEETQGAFSGLHFCTDTGVLNRGEASLEVSLNIGRKLSTLKLQDASATSLNDKQMIDNVVDTEMGGFDHMNHKLRSHIHKALEASKTAMESKFDDLFNRLDHPDNAEGFPDDQLLHSL